MTTPNESFSSYRYRVLVDGQVAVDGLETFASAEAVVLGLIATALHRPIRVEKLAIDQPEQGPVTSKVRPAVLRPTYWKDIGSIADIDEADGSVMLVGPRGIWPRKIALASRWQGGFAVEYPGEAFAKGLSLKDILANFVAWAYPPSDPCNET